MKNVSYFLQYVLIRAILRVFRLLSLTLSSATGGWILRKIGPWLKWQKIADYNLRLIHPDWSEEQYAETLDKMWDNLGRNFAEISWLGSSALKERISFDEETLACFEEMKASDKPVVFTSGHVANWELTPIFGAMNEVPLTLIYRHLNNPYLEKHLYQIRSQYCAELQPKGREGAKALLKTLRQGGKVGLMTDQKQNDGESILFMGKEAPTATGMAELTLKFNAQLYSVRCIRKERCHFEGEIRKIPYDKTMSATKLTQLNNQMLEKWIEEAPHSWLWVHQRWGKIRELEKKD
jgi:KDO2-lipid IV(A) lauroyltransferase